MNKLNKESVTGISALLVHAANIDEIYSDHEKDLIKNFIRSYLSDQNTDEILKDAEKIESNSNQLLNFTNIIKKNSIEIKKDIVEHLWKVIISDNTVDQYEFYYLHLFLYLKLDLVLILLREYLFFYL